MLGTDIAVTRWDHSVDVTQTYLVTRAANDPSVLTITDKVLIGAFSVIMNLRVDLRLKLYCLSAVGRGTGRSCWWWKERAVTWLELGPDTGNLSNW